jgi:hypothetical protein
MMFSPCNFAASSSGENKILRDFPRDARRLAYHIATLRAMAQGMIHQDQRQHGFGNRRRTDANTGVVTPFGGHLNGIAVTSIERRAWAIDEVGLIAILTTISWPVEMPPSTPPA